MSAYCLEMHAGYLCRHAGACCTSGWPIHAEAATVEAVTLHLGPAARDRFVWSAGSEAPTLALRGDGSCTFFESSPYRLCEIHRTAGVAALPSACRHFPRVVLADARGVRVSLSHYCPTAAATLFGDAPARQVAAPPNLTLAGTAEGLDARNVLPPLLRPAMLMDADGCDAWEREALVVLSDRLPVDKALDVLEAAALSLESWRPGLRSLADAVEDSFVAARDQDGQALAQYDDCAAFAIAAGAVPDGVPRTAVPRNGVEGAAARVFNDYDRVVKRYIAARLFGSWTPYFATRLVTIVRSLRIHMSVLRLEIQRRAGLGEDDAVLLTEAIRATDLLLIHHADPRALAVRIEQTT